MFSATVQADTDVLDAVSDEAQQSPSRMRREAGLVARGPTVQRIINELSQEPPPPKRPIRWTSDKQRKFVMALLRRTGNVPRQRRHKEAQGWRGVLSSLDGDNGGVISIENSTPYSDFVQGERQQGFLSQWRLARTVIRNYQEPLQDEVIDAWGRATGVNR